MSEKITKFKTFLNLLENFSLDFEEYKKIISPDMIQIEYPNLITKNGQTRKIAGLEGIKKGKEILSEQKYELIKYYEVGNTLITEVIWTGKMSNDFAHLKKDQELKAYICMVTEFEDGKIIQQRNYDCYEPF